MAQQNTIQAQDDLGIWFDNFVATLRSHQLQIETDTAPKELKALYEDLFSGNMESILKASKQASQEFFVKRIILDYLKKLEKNLPKKLAFDFNDSEVLVWAEVEDDNAEMERKLIMTEASVNAKYHDYGFAMNSTIVESDDEMPIPNHYKIYQA